MLRSRWTLVAALLPAVLPALVWVVGALVRSLACPAWCLTCTHSCRVAGLDLSWLTAWGVVSPYLLLFTAPVSAVLVIIAISGRRREVAT